VGLEQGRTLLIVDSLAALVGLSLPWSTSATMILVVLWALSLLLAMVPDVDLPLLGRVIRTPAGALPVILVVVGLIGIGWAHVPWSERIGGFDWFPKLLVIPLLMVQFHRSPRGHWVLLGFLLSATVLLMLSWYLYFTPYPPWRIKDVADPFKDRITQGTEFTLCLFGLLELAAYAWKNARFREASLAASLAALYFLNIMFATVSRTALVAVPTLLVLFGFRYLTWPRMVAFVAGLAVVAGILWVSSPYLRERVSNIPEEITTFQALNHDTSAGSRLKFWERSIEIMSEAPLAGHGTGAITATFSGITGTTRNATNPHNQIMTIGIQLGLIGVAILIAMWGAHVRMFCATGLINWIGLVVVAENIIASMFNSQLSDFTTGWIYVLGVGVTGGMLTKAGLIPYNGRQL
jgi:O-antigen ligase